METISVFTSLYAGAKRSGFLETRIGSQLFSSAYFLYKRHLEDPFAGFIGRYPQLFQGGHILDVGANIGYTAALFSRVVDPGRSVFAFEPEPFNFRLLNRVAGTRTGRAVVPVQSAVGAAAGEIRLLLNPRHHGDHRVLPAGQSADGDAIAVPLVTIDGFLEQRRSTTPIAFMKVDVQGYELAVCQGAEQTLARNPKCCVALEYGPEGAESLGLRPADLLAWMKERGYSAYELHKDGSLTPGVPEVLPARGYVDLLFSREKQSAVRRQP